MIRRPVKFKPRRPKRQPNAEPFDSRMKNWLRMKRDEPKRFERMTRGKDALLSAIESFERMVKQ